MKREATRQAIFQRVTMCRAQRALDSEMKAALSIFP